MNRIAPVFAPPRRLRLIAMIANGMAQGALAMLGTQLVGRAFGSEAFPPALLLTGFVGAALATAGLRIHEVMTAESLGQQYAIESRMRLFQHLLRADPAATEKLSTGVLMLRFVTDLNGLRQWASLGLSRLFTATATMAVALGLLAWQSPELAWPAAAAVTVTALLIALATPRLRAAERKLRKRRGRLAALAHTELTDLRSARSRDRAEDATNRMQGRSDRVASAANKRARVRGQTRALADLGAWAALAGVVLAAGHGFAAATLAMPEVVAALTLTSLLAAPIATLVRSVEYRQGYVVACAKINRVLALKTADAGASNCTDVGQDDYPDSQPGTRMTEFTARKPGSGWCTPEFTDAGLIRLVIRFDTGERDEYDLAYSGVGSGTFVRREIRNGALAETDSD